MRRRFYALSSFWRILPENHPGGCPQSPATAGKNIRLPKSKFVPESQESFQQGYFHYSIFSCQAKTKAKTKIKTAPKRQLF